MSSNTIESGKLISNPYRLKEIASCIGVGVCSLVALAGLSLIAYLSTHHAAAHQLYHFVHIKPGLKGMHFKSFPLVMTGGAVACDVVIVILLAKMAYTSRYAHKSLTLHGHPSIEELYQSEAALITDKNV